MKRHRKNRRISRIVRKSRLAPKNMRIEDLRKRSMNRLTLWFILTLFALCSSTATMYLMFLNVSAVTDGTVVNLLRVYSFASFLFGAFCLKRTFDAWDSIMRYVPAK